MQFIIPFVTSFASYLIISYFIYNILGRKRTLSFVLLGLIFASSVFSWVTSLRPGLEVSVLIISFMLSVLPVIFATYLFISVSGGIRFSFLTPKKRLKTAPLEIQTKKMMNVVATLMIIGSIIFGLLAYFYLDDYIKYVVITALACSFLFGIIALAANLKINKEAVILIVGKKRQRIFEYSINKTSSKVAIKDFFTNSNYIADPIGVAILKKQDKTITKHYLFWIATNDKIDMAQEPVKQLEGLNYYDHLPLFEKYNYRTITFEIQDNVSAKIIKNKKL